MKIRPEEIHGAQQQENAQRTRQERAKSSFEDMLRAQQDRGEKPAEAGTLPPPLANPLLGVGQTGAPSQTEPVMKHVENLLEEWENYAGKLENPGEGDLKEAYGVLERIGSEVRRIKEERPNLAQENPDLNSLVDELEIMSVTETIKFNRGDYI
ncbi:hypothetical protein [Desulfohalovibrio reitneri]|uniref:hypothetical protein n=1 Tax=Desulfohalovibrio reitneri TaxID=1307759 RepID=UPI0004A7453E|nr:hypothetical protein [Desulfohalovibrio reitneri]